MNLFILSTTITLKRRMVYIVLEYTELTVDVPVDSEALVSILSVK